MNVIDFEFFGFDVPTVFPHIRPAGIIILHGLQMRVLLKTLHFYYIRLLEFQVLLELRVLFEGGPYMRKYGISAINFQIQIS